MPRFDRHSIISLTLNLVARTLLYAIYLFVFIGEVVSACVLVPARLILQHIRVVYYISRFGISQSGRAFASIKKHMDQFILVSVKHILDRGRSLVSSPKTTLLFGKQSIQDIREPFHSSFSWQPNLFSRPDRISQIQTYIRALLMEWTVRISQVVHTLGITSARAIKTAISVPARTFSVTRKTLNNIKGIVVRIQQSLIAKLGRAKNQSMRKRVDLKLRRRYRYQRIAVVVILFCIFASATYGIYNFYIDLPSPQDIGKVNFALSTHVYDRNGKALYSFYKDEQRTPVRLQDLPPYIAQATVAIEDKDFYHHNGISVISGIARAFRDTFLRDRGIQGGSTITQQLVKTALLSPERTLLRKFREAIIALETERVFSKDEILEMYLNQVPYGGSAYGIEEASQKFFGKNAKDITLSEAALLAGLPQAPTNYSPFTNFKATINRRNQVLFSMLEQGYISSKEYEQAFQEKIDIAQDKVYISAPHFVFYVRKQLESTFDTNELYQGGYRVYTTLDLDIQKRAEEILREELDKIQNLNVGNGAILVLNPLNGDILAMVGSANYFDGKSGEYNVTTALRQPGSSIKPIMYSYALERGYTAATIIDDAPTVFQSLGSESYRPVNYDGRFHGKVTLRNALGNSFNIPAVKVMNRLGVEDFIFYANHLGIDTWQDPSDYGLSIALGGGDVTMLNMAQAYGVLANAGRFQEIVSISEILDKKGKVLKQQKIEPEQIVDPAYAYIISDILSDNQARVQAFGPGSQLEIPGYKVAVKTGTTDEKRDNWTIGYTPDYLVLVWVGNNDHTPMNPYLTSGVTGAAPIWNRMMKYLLEERNKGGQYWYVKPDNVVQKMCFGRMESFVVGTENSVPCSLPKPTPKELAGGN